MSNLNGIPSADYFETKLANTWNWTVGTVYVEEVPSASMPISEYSYIVVNPWESNMQVAKIDWWDIDNKTFNVIDVVVDSGAWTQYTAKTHPLGALVRFSNNYAFWKDIQTAINTKADDSDISTVWKSNDYNDLDNLPTFATVATSGDYDDLINTPTPITIAVWDKVLQLSWSNVLSATVTASYDSWTKKITLYGANSVVISEIDCTAFIKDGMIQDVKIVTDPAWYAPWKYLEFDFNTDSGVEDIYIALSDLAVYTAWTWIDITSNAISLKKATTNSLWWVIVWSGLSVNDWTVSANSQTDENYTTAEKTKLSWIANNAQVNVIEDVKVNWTSLPVSAKAVDVKIKTINGNSLTWSGDLDLMARTYSAGTWIDITSDTISINSTYQTTIANKANSADLASVATSWNSSDLNNDAGFLVSTDLQAWTNVQITGTTISATDTTYTASDFDIKDLTDSTSLMSTWSWKQDTMSAWTWIDVTSNKISTASIYWVSTTAAATVQKEVSIPSITELNVWQVIIVKPTVTSTVADSTLKLNNFDAYTMLYNAANITTSTDSVVRAANIPSMFYLDEVSGTKYWRFLWHWLDSNTTYTLNYLFEAWKTKAWSGSYAISRYAICMQKADWTWETLKETSTNYSTWTSKSANTNWFIPTQIRYYNTTTVVANGAYIGTNTMQEKCAKLTASYSFNCWGTPWWTAWQNIYLVWTISNWLFYLDTTARWTTTLPNSADWKVYILLWQALTTTDSTMTLTEQHPIFYHDGTGIKDYYSNKQDKSAMVTTLTWADNDHYPTAKAVADAIQWAWAWDMLASVYDPNSVWADAFDYTNFINTPTIPSNTSDLNNDSGFITSSSLPWTATSSTAWLVKLASDTTQSVAANAVSSTASRTYWIQLNSSNQAVVNVPREDHTYTASNFDIKDLTDSTSLRTTWSGKQDALVNQTNIKSVQWISLLGSGDLTVWTVMTETAYWNITPVNWVMYFTTA